MNILSMNKNDIIYYLNQLNINAFRHNDIDQSDLRNLSEIFNIKVVLFNAGDCLLLSGLIKRLKKLKCNPKLVEKIRSVNNSLGNGIIISELPVDILKNISDRLDVNDRNNFRQTCSRILHPLTDLKKILTKASSNKDNFLSYLRFHGKNINNLDLNSFFILIFNWCDTDFKLIAKYCPNLESLSVEDVPITDGGLANLLSLSSLKSLNLNGCRQLTKNGFEHLKNFKNLENLELSYTKLEDEDLKEIAKISSLRHLKILKCGDEGIKHLKNLKNLESLEFSFHRGILTKISKINSLRKLKTREIDLELLINLPLKELSLREISSKSLDLLKQFHSLESLDLSTCNIDKRLSNLKTLPNLKNLIIRHTETTDDDLVDLNPNLKSLDLSYNKGITNRGLAHIPSGVNSLKLYQNDIDSLEHLKVKDLKFLSTDCLNIEGIAVKCLELRIDEINIEVFIDKIKLCMCYGLGSLKLSTMISIEARAKITEGLKGLNVSFKKPYELSYTQTT